MSVLLKCENLEFGYRGRSKRNADVQCTGLSSSFSFELQAGEVIALMGENGCGKSTLLKTLAGLIPMLSGSISISQQDVNSISPRDLAKKIALVRMSGIAPDRMTVREFVSLGRSPYAGVFDGRNSEDESAIDDAIALLELNSFVNRQVASLSDGERSRVYLAEAVAQQALILLLDEPNAFLDIPRSHKLFKLLQKLARERGMGIVVSTHSVEYAEKYCDRIMVINEGLVRVANANEARSEGLLDWTENE